MPHKVFFDTNLFMAGSIVETSGELGFQIKHDFYDQATKLIQYIKRNPAKQIGMTTFFIESEAYNTLSNAVETEIKKHVKGEEKEFNALSAVLNICTDNMREIFMYLIRAPVDSGEVFRINNLVDSFYRKLRELARRKYEELEKNKDKSVSRTPRIYKKFMRRVYSQQDRWPFAQLLNLIEYKYVEPNDRRILSEVIHLHQVNKSIQGETVKTYLASTDYHFSPIRMEGRVSGAVSRAIKRDFDIICDWPDVICDLIKK